VPVVRADVLKVAAPLPLSVPVPRVVAPSLKVTVPVGVPALHATVAVKVTAWPTGDGVSDELTVVVVAVWLT
jgi:hypothetical protein